MTTVDPLVSTRWTHGIWNPSSSVRRPTVFDMSGFHLAVCVNSSNASVAALGHSVPVVQPMSHCIKLNITYMLNNTILTMPKTSGNAPTLPFIGHLSSLWNRYHKLRITSKSITTATEFLPSFEFWKSPSSLLQTVNKLLRCKSFNSWQFMFIIITFITHDDDSSCHSRLKPTSSTILLHHTLLPWYLTPDCLHGLYTVF